MPVSTFRCTLFFEHRGQGWTESFYRQEGSHATAMDKLINLGSARVLLLTKNAFQLHCRVSDVDHPRDARFRTFGKGASRGKWGELNANDPPVGAAINVRLWSGESRWRSYLLRGLGLGMYDSSPLADPVVTQAFKDAFKVFFTFLQDNDWKMYLKPQGAGTTVTGYTAIDKRMVQFACPAGAPPAGFVPGATVQLKGCTSVSNFNGNWRIRDVDDFPTVRVYPKVQYQVGTMGNEIITAKVLAPVLGIFTDWTTVGLTKRDTGRPSYQPRGKRSVRKL